MKWKEEFHGLILTNGRIDCLDYSVKAGMEKFLRKTVKSDLARKKHRFLPKTLAKSKGLICTWLASSFCERVNLVANQAFIEVNSLLLPDEVGMIATLRTSRDF